MVNDLKFPGCAYSEMRNEQGYASSSWPCQLVTLFPSAVKAASDEYTQLTPGSSVCVSMIVILGTTAVKISRLTASALCPCSGSRLTSRDIDPQSRNTPLVGTSGRAVHPKTV